MEASELILIDSRKVRSSPDLMSIYIEAYQNQFGRKPNCAGCTFADDWKRFILAVRSGNEPTRLTLNKRQMDQTFKLKKVQMKILSYREGGKTFRLYDNKLTENFVLGYLINGTEEEIKERKALFTVLPEALRDEPKAKSVNPVKDDEPVIEITEQEKPEVVDVEIKHEEPVKEKKTRAKRGSKKNK